MGKGKELWDELRSVFSGRGSRLLDSTIPPLLFILVNPLADVTIALWISLGAAGIFALWRIGQKQSLVYALGGLGATVLAAVLVKLSGSGTGFFLPGLISGAVTVLLCVVSVALNRPLVAWTSYLARRWTLAWYWHPQVLPAYNEVTIGWGVAFAARLLVEFWFYQQEATGALGAARLILGWPFTLLLLVITYLYGIWRLGKLGGPSVSEFDQEQAPPWEGQRKGF